MGRGDISFARAAMKLVCMLLGIILILMTGLTGYMMHLTRQLPQLSGRMTSLLENAGDGTFLSSALTEKVNQAKVQNYLLIGQDRREGETGNRSDSMILCSFNRQTKQLVMTSILRDLYVPIPGHGSNRINAAYAFGGAPLLMQTLEENFAIPIDGSIEVNFDQFSGILDQLGGVTLELRRDEAEVINRELGSSLSQGIQTLTGEQALAYSRIRSLDVDGDFSRTDRQRKVLNGVWEAYKDSSLPTLIKTVGKLMPLIETDLGSGELLSAAVSVFPYLSEIQIISHRIPEADYCADQVIDGMAVLKADPEIAKQRLYERIYGHVNAETGESK